MAFNHVEGISQKLASYEWLTEDWVKNYVGKKANKRARAVVALHIARQFAIAPAIRNIMRVQCSSIAEGEEQRYLARGSFGKEGIGDMRCECTKNPAKYVCVPFYRPMVVEMSEFVTNGCVK